LFESDFPSAHTLKERGIFKCLVVRDPVFQLGDDLRYALLPWAKAEISIELSDLGGAITAVPVPPSGFFGAAIYRMG
jgi:hypothetical protein